LKNLEIFGFEGWRIAFVVGCLPGIIIAILLLFLEDPRKSVKSSPALVGETNNCNYGTAASNSKDQIKKNRAQCVKILSSFNFLISGNFLYTFILMISSHQLAKNDCYRFTKD
jgi:MFS family permease